jgi:hypothetical protein
MEGAFCYLCLRNGHFEIWWPGTELNRRRQPFQGCALPPELPGHVDCRSTAARLRVMGYA